MSIFDYEANMHKDLDSLMRTNGYSTKQDAFIHWCLRTITDTEDDTCAESYTNGANDLTIDSIMILEDNDPPTIYIMQDKFITSQNNKIDRDAIDTFVKHSTDLLGDETFASQGNANIVRLGTEARHIITDKPDTKVVLCYCNFGEYTPNALEALKQANRGFKKEQSHQNWELRLYDKKRLLETYAGTLDIETTPPNTTLPIIDKQAIDYDQSINILDKSTPLKSALFITDAQNIGELRNSEGRNLFDINVRYSLGKSNIVNSCMYSTLTDIKERDKFLLYNNGIYAICDDFDIDEKKTKVDIKGLQVVNGCQTCSIFGDAIYGNLNIKDVKVIMRLVKITGDKKRMDKLTENISKFVNTQNAVRWRDVRANDSIQNRLFNAFQVLTFFDNRYFYERKTKEYKHFKQWKPHMARGRDKIDNVAAAQAFLSFVKQDPAKAKAGANILFRDNYTQVFDTNLEASHLFYPWAIYEKARTFVEDEKSKPNQEYLANSHSTLVAIVGYCFGMRFGCTPSNIAKLSKEFGTMGKNEFNKHVDYYLQLAHGVLNDVAQSKNGGNQPDKNFDSRKFFLDSGLLKNSVIPQLKNTLTLLGTREGGNIDKVLIPR